MPIDDGMTVNERQKYLAVSPRYRKAGRVEQGILLNEMAVVTGLHRKSLLGGLSSKNALGVYPVPSTPSLHTF